MKSKFLTGLVLGMMILFSGCETDSTIASKNLSKAAEMFEIDRRIVFYNGITNDYILSIEGKCSIKKDVKENQLEVTCKVGENAFKKHFLGISDNVTYFAEHLTSTNVSTYHYRVVFKPQTIIPDIDFRGSTKEVIKAVTPDNKN